MSPLLKLPAVQAGYRRDKKKLRGGRVGSILPVLAEVSSLNEGNINVTCSFQQFQIDAAQVAQPVVCVLIGEKLLDCKNVYE